MSDDIAFWAQINRDAQRTVCCEPSQVDAVRAAVARAGMTGTISVVGSAACPPGRLFIIDAPAIEASNREALQRAFRAWPL